MRDKQTSVSENVKGSEGEGGISKVEGEMKTELKTNDLRKRRSMSGEQTK